MLSKRLLMTGNGTEGQREVEKAPVPVPTTGEFRQTFTGSGTRQATSSTSSSSSSSSSGFLSIPNMANTAKNRIESYVKYLRDRIFRGQVTDEEIYFRLARRINQLFPNNLMGEDLELIAMCTQETASLVRFEWANKSDVTPYVLIKNIFQNLVKRSPELWDGVKKRRAMAYIIPVVFTWLSGSNKTSIPDVYRLISKNYHSVDTKYRSRPVWALNSTEDLQSGGFVDEVYETLKTEEYDNVNLLKQITVAQSKSTYNRNGLPILLQLSKERFLERFSLLPLPVLSSFGMSLQMPDLNDENTIGIHRLEFLGGEPIIQSLPRDDYWYPGTGTGTGLGSKVSINRSWSFLRKSWESAKREAAELEASLSQERIRDKDSEKRFARSYSDDEED